MTGETCGLILSLLICCCCCPAWGQGLVRIQVLEGEGVVNGAGARSTRPIVAQLTDETGRPLEGVAVSFRLPEEGPGGVFETGLKTDVVITTAEGRAAVHGIRWNRIAGPFQIRITAVKGESRAGTVCSQYISDTPVKSSAVGMRSGKTKWLAMVAVATGGAAAAGIWASKGAASRAPGAVVAPPPVVSTSIGLPTLTVTRP